MSPVQNSRNRPPPPSSRIAPKAENKKIGVSVAYLKVPFYANFKTGLEDGAKQFGFTYDLVDGNSGDVAAELANLQNFVAQKRDLIILTPSGEGIIPGIKLVNDAGMASLGVSDPTGPLEDMATATWAACRPQLFDAAVIQSISNLDASHGMIERC